jgi:hypothetical protein
MCFLLLQFCYKKIINERFKNSSILFLSGVIPYDETLVWIYFITTFPYPSHNHL